MVGLGVVEGAPPAESAAAKKVKCDPAAGWAAVTGRAPSFIAGGATGLYIWQERGVWRVGATNDRAAPTTFTATVSFDAPITGRPVGTEGKSDIVDFKKQSVQFRFSNFGGLDGVAIESPCATTVTVQGQVNGQALTAQQVFFGPTATNPAAMPAVMTKAASTTQAVAPTTVGSAQSGASQSGVSQSAAAATACPTTSWPASLIGQPKFRRGPAGIYAWIDGKGTLRLAFEADPGAPRSFDGRILANAPITLGQNSLEGPDQIKVAGQQVTFSLKVGGAGDSFDVIAPCASSFSIEGTVDGVPIAPAQVFVGPSATSPAAVPVVLSRP
jgi:hypothetical protein